VAWRWTNISSHITVDAEADVLDGGRRKGSEQAGTEVKKVRRKEIHI
jgi:hypothetical protein